MDTNPTVVNTVPFASESRGFDFARRRTSPLADPLSSKIVYKRGAENNVPTNSRQFIS